VPQNKIMQKSKRGRPKLAKDDRRTETLRVRLTVSEKAAVEAQSDNPSEWARKRLLTGIKARNGKGPPSLESGPVTD